MVAFPAHGTTNWDDDLLSWLNVARKFNVQDYGATGDGSADDTTEIQAAVDACESAGGGVVSFPKGTYFVSSQILNDSPNVMFVGVGARASVIKWTGAFTPLRITSTGCSVRMLGFDGNYPTQTTGEAIAFVDASDFTVSDCRFTDIPETAISLTRPDQAWICDNRFSNIGKSAVRVNNPGSGNASRYVRVLRNHIVDANETNTPGFGAIQVHGTTNITNEYMWVEDNTIIGGKKVGIGLDLIVQGWVRGNRVVGDGATGECIAILGSHVVCDGNHVEGAGSAGILYAGSPNYGAPTGDAHVIIANNTCKANGSSGIQVEWFEANGTTLRDITIIGNNCVDNSGYGIHFILGGIPLVTSGDSESILVALNDLTNNGGLGVGYGAGLTANGIVEFGNRISHAGDSVHFRADRSRVTNAGHIDVADDQAAFRVFSSTFGTLLGRMTKGVIDGASTLVIQGEAARPIGVIPGNVSTKGLVIAAPSGHGAKLLDLEVNSVSKFSVDQNGRILSASPLAVTGSRAGNAALASLLTQLAALGLITDSTTA